MIGSKKSELDPLIIDVIKSYWSPLKPLPTSVEPLLRELKGIKAVLFDVYGTLMISGSGEVGSANEVSVTEPFTQALIDSGYEDAHVLGAQAAHIFFEEIKRTHTECRATGIDFPEVNVQKIWGAVFAKLDVTKDTQDSMQRRLPEIAIRHECLSNPTSPMPGALEIVGQLSEKGAVIGIVSNAQFYTPYLFNAYFDLSLAEAGFSDDACAWSYVAGIAKPAVELFEGPLKYLENEHGILASETLYVGNDMLNDVWASKELGCWTALFAGDRRSLRLRTEHSRASLVSPDVTITELEQLSGVIK